MADKNKAKQVRLQRRKFNLRSSLFGSPQRPRLSVFRSDKHISAQVIDDYAGKTLVSATSSAEVRGELNRDGKSQTQTKRVVFKAGESVTVDFTV